MTRTLPSRPSTGKTSPSERPPPQAACLPRPSILALHLHHPALVNYKQVFSQPLYLTIASSTRLLCRSSKLTAINEVDVLCRLKHSSIVGYKGCFTTNESVRQNLGFIRSERNDLHLQDGDMEKTRNIPSCPNQEGHTLCVLMEYADVSSPSLPTQFSSSPSPCSPACTRVLEAIGVV